MIAKLKINNKDISNSVNQATKQAQNVANKNKINLKINVNNSGINNLHNSMQNLGRTVQNTNTVFGKLKNTITNTFSNGKIAMTGYLLALNEINKAGKEAKETVKEIDKAITDLQIATDMKRESVIDLVKDYNKYAKQLSSTTTQITSAADDYLRAGKSLEESQTLIKDSIMLSKLGKLDSGEATEDLLATMNGFEMSVEEVGKALDSMVAIDMKAATSAGDIATALKYSASSADVAGVSFDKLAAMIGTVQDKTQQSAETIGTFMNTILSRYRNVKIGQFVDDDGEDISDVETVLKSLNIQLRDNNQEFRSFETIIDEVAAQWDNYSSVQQAAIAKAFSGTRQQNRFIALMEGYNKVLELTEVAANSAGTAIDKFNNSYADSLEAKQNTLQASFESMIMNSDFDEVYAGILEATTALVEFINKTNALKGVFAGLALAGGIKAFLSIKTGVTEAYIALNQFQQALNLVKQPKISTNDFTRLLLLSKNLSASQTKLILSSKNLTLTQKKQILMNQGLSASEAKLKLQNMGLATSYTGLKAATVSVTNACKGLFSTLLANPIFLITTAISGVTMAWESYKQNIEEINSRAKESAEASKTLINDLSDLTSKYFELSKAVQADESAKDELISTQSDLLKKLGLEGESVDGLTAKYGSLSEAIRQASISKLKDAQIDLLSGLNVAENDLISDGKGYEKSYSLIDRNIINATGKESIKAFKVLENAGIINSGSYGSNGGAFVLTGDESVNGILKNYQKIQDALRALQNEISATDLKNNDLFIALKARSDEMQESVENYQSSVEAINKGAAQIVTLDILKNIDIPDTKEAFESFKQELVETAIASEQFIGNEADIKNSIDAYLSTLPEFVGYYNDEIKNEVSNASEAGKQIVTSLSDKLLNSKEAISTFTSSVESAYSAYSKLMKSNLSSSDIISSIQSINDAASNMGDSINWDFLDKQENSLELLGEAIEDISRKYAESVLSGAGIDVDSKFGQMLANNIIQAQKSSIELENLNDGLDSLQSAYSSLTDIVESYNKTGYFTFDQLQSLLELEPQYLACLIDENGQLQLNEQAMTALANQRLNDAEAQAVQQAITELNEITLQDEKTAAEENGNAFYNAISKIAGYNQELSTMIANATVGAAQIRDLNAALQGAESRGASDDQIQTVLDNLNLKLNAIDSARAKVNSGGLGSVVGSKSSKSGSKKEEDKWLEEYKNKLSALQDELDKELINEREFYDKSEALMNEYLKDSPEHIKKYEEEIASAEKSLHGDWANAYQAEHDAIEDLYNDGKISVKEYYSQLKRLAKGYGFTGEAIGKYGKYTKEAAEAQKELNEIAKDALDNAIKGATYLIDKQIDKYNKLKDAADDSYNAQIKALDMQIDGLNDQIDSIDDLIDELEDQADAIDDQIDLIEDQTDAIDDQIDAIDDQIESIDNQIKAIENEIENYDRLIDEKQKIIDQMQDENDERDRQMKLQKAQAELDKALNNNTTSTFSGGQWTYKNNEDEVSTARENVRDAQNDINVAEIQKEIDLLNEGRDALQAQIDLFEKQKEELQSQIDLFEKQKEALQEQIDLFEKQKEAIQDQIDSYEKQKDAIQEQIDLIEKQKEAIQESMEKSDEYFEKMIKSIEETKSRWEELSELDTNAKMMQDMEDVFNKLGYTAQDVLNMSDKTFAEFKDKYLNYMMSVKGESDSVRQALSTMANVSDIQWLDDYLARTGVGLGNIASIDLTGTVGSIDGVNDGLHIVKDSSGDTKDSIITGMGEVSDTSTDTANTIITGMDDVTVASNVTSESVSADLGTVKESAYDTSKAINGGKDAKSKSDSLTTALKDTKDTASITVPAVSQMFDNVTSSVKDSTKAVDDLRAAIERLNSTKVTAPGVSVNSKTFSVPKHAKGAKRIKEDEWAWTQEEGGEVIVSPSRNAIYTPLNVGDSVFTNEMSENLWEWGKLNPNFLMDHMEFGKGVNATKTTINNNNSSVMIENINLNLPNVTNDSGVEYIQKELTKLSNNLKVGKYQYFNKI